MLRTAATRLEYSRLTNPELPTVPHGCDVYNSSLFRVRCGSAAVPAMHHGTVVPGSAYEPRPQPVRRRASTPLLESPADSASWRFNRSRYVAMKGLQGAARSDVVFATGSDFERQVGQIAPALFCTCIASSSSDLDST